MKKETTSRNNNRRSGSWEKKPVVFGRAVVLARPELGDSKALIPKKPKGKNRNCPYFLNET